jgi:hypothetical protein
MSGMNHLVPVLTCVLGLLVTGCAKPVAIQHVVLLKLNDPNQSQACLNDCDRLLPGIDGVIEYWSGTPDDSGRVSETIDTNWDVALCLGYADGAAYERYVNDPAHVLLVSTWKPRLTWLRIHDVSVGR